ncbi:hypothetical protein V8E55_004596 [Tylopilus felleus]
MNQSALHDYQATLNKIFEEVAMWYGTDNTMLFWEDVLKLKSHHIAKQFELWTFSQGKKRMPDAVSINGSFCQCVGDHTWLIYIGFESTIKERHSGDVIGWPPDVPFTSPYNMSNVELMRRLHNVLKAHHYSFIKMSPHQYKAFLEELADGVDASEVGTLEGERQGDVHKEKGTYRVGMESERS